MRSVPSSLATDSILKLTLASRVSIVRWYRSTGSAAFICSTLAFILILRYGATIRLVVFGAECGLEIPVRFVLFPKAFVAAGENKSALAREFGITRQTV